MHNVNENLRNNYTTTICALNLGYCNCKVKYSNEDYGTFIFPSKVREYTDEPIDKTVIINGKRYVVGSGNYDFNLNKTISLNQDKLVRYALNKIPYDIKNVIISMPANIFLNQKARLDYYKFIKSFSDVKECVVYMESASLSYKYYEELFANKTVTLLDIGGFTISAMVFNNGELIKQYCVTLPMGILPLNDKIKTYIEQHEYTQLVDDQIQYMYKDEEVKKIINNHLYELQSVLTKKGFPSPNKCDYVATGGGADVLRNELINRFNCYIGKNPIFENVLSLYDIGCDIFD